MYTQYRGSENVPAGSYFCLTTGSYASLPQDGALPGAEKDRFIRLNVLLMLILGPLTGLIFVLVLPLMAPVFLIWMAVRASQSGKAGPKRLRPAPVTRLAEPQGA